MIQLILTAVLLLSCLNGSQGDVNIKSCLNAHNALRALHKDTPALKWDNELAKKAQVYAEKLVQMSKASKSIQFKHEKPANGMGENLYYQDNKILGTCVDASLAWYNEIKDYSYATAKSTNGKAIGHFTQMVWRDTLKFGVGIATMTSLKYAKYGNKVTYIVAKYSPQGNFYITGKKKEYYTKNVKPRNSGAVTPSAKQLDPSHAQE